MSKHAEHPTEQRLGGELPHEDLTRCSSPPTSPPPSDASKHRRSTRGTSTRTGHAAPSTTCSSRSGRTPTTPKFASTPRRVAQSFGEMLTPTPFSFTTFPNDGAYDQLVVARSIPMRSLCAHHLLPFIGVAHVAYLPGDRILGLSKLARVVDHFSRELQIQERLTTQVGEWLDAQLAPKGVGVIIEAEHLCMTLRGVQAHGTRTVTSSLHGLVSATTPAPVPSSCRWRPAPPEARRRARSAVVPGGPGVSRLRSALPARLRQSASSIRPTSPSSRR